MYEVYKSVPSEQIFVLSRGAKRTIFLQYMIECTNYRRVVYQIITKVENLLCTKYNACTKYQTVFRKFDQNRKSCVQPKKVYQLYFWSSCDCTVCIVNVALCIVHFECVCSI